MAKYFSDFQAILKKVIYVIASYMLLYSYCSWTCKNQLGEYNYTKLCFDASIVLNLASYSN